MKYYITFIYQYIVIFSMALLITPAKTVHTCEKMSEIKIEKNIPAAPEENTSDVLHGEMLFRY